MSDNRHIAAQPEDSYIKWSSSGRGEIELGILQMQILWLLSRKSTHGYELMKALTVLKGIEMTQGTLYPTLKRLEELGMIKGANVERKIVYHITAKGRKTINDTCLEFVKTFYGIFHDFACQSCSFYGEHHKGGNGKE